MSRLSQYDRLGLTSFPRSFQLFKERILTKNFGFWGEDGILLFRLIQNPECLELPYYFTIGISLRFHAMKWWVWRCWSTYLLTCVGYFGTEVSLRSCFVEVSSALSISSSVLTDCLFLFHLDSFYKKKLFIELLTILSKKLKVLWYYNEKVSQCISILCK